MRTALCLYGNLRSFSTVFPSLHQHVLQVYSPDVFSFVWKNTHEIAVNKFDRNHPIWDIKNSKKKSIISDDTISSLIEKTNSKISLVEDYQNQILSDQKDWNLPKALYKNLWAQSRCVKLKQLYENQHHIQYDLVILSRWDIFYESNLMLNISDCLRFPTRFCYAGPSDFWTYGPSKMIDVCANRFDFLQKKNPNEHPNKLLNQLLDSYNISYEMIDLPVNLLNRPY